MGLALAFEDNLTILLVKFKNFRAIHCDDNVINVFCGNNLFSFPRPMYLTALWNSHEGSFVSRGVEIGIGELRALELKNEVIINGGSKDILVDFVCAFKGFEWVNYQVALSILLGEDHIPLGPTCRVEIFYAFASKDLCILLNVIDAKDCNLRKETINASSNTGHKRQSSIFLAEDQLQRLKHSVVLGG